MVTLLKREFTVNISVERAWDHLAHVEQWPSWAPHIKKIELRPPGELGPNSTGVIHLAGGIRSPFRMTEFNPPRSWKWAGPFLWVTVVYDHWFENLDSDRTKLIWIIQAKGFGAGILGRFFARIYRRSLDKAIPLLIREMNSINVTELSNRDRDIFVAASNKADAKPNKALADAAERYKKQI